MVQLDRPKMTIWRTYKARWITKAINTYLEYVILTAFPLQKCLHESAKMLCYTQFACLSTISFEITQTRSK